jgi:signal recognition particle subunit SRP54
MFETLTQRLTSVFSSLRGSRELDAAALEDGLRSVRQALLEADVQFGVARDFTARVQERLLGQERLHGVEPAQQFVHAFHKELVELLGPAEARLVHSKEPPTVVLLAGLQGAGKTTTCAKLAQFLRDKHQRRPLLVAADVKRPAAVEQLRVLGRQLGMPVFHEEGLAPPELCERGVMAARRGGQDVVLLDTAGRLHVDDELMAEVSEIARRTKPHNQVLVVDAMTGQDAVRSAQAFHARLELTGVILTKLDGDARGGAAVSLKQVVGRPILFVGTGEKLGDLEAFQPERMAGRILGMGDVVGLVEKAQEAISEREAQDTYEKVVRGSFTLEDLLGMMRMMKRLGPMKKVLGMLPGVGSALENADLDDKTLVHKEALLTSMTPRERLRPDLLDMSRRRRIARGAGQDIGAVNELLKSYKFMGQAMKQMGRMNAASSFGAKAKAETLRKMSGAEAAEERGGFPGLGALGGLGSLGGLAGLPGGGGGLPALGAGGAGAAGRGGPPRPPGGKSNKELKKQRKKERKRGRR